MLEAYGGRNLILRHVTTIAEALGKSLLPELLVPVSVLTTSVLVRTENDSLKQRLLPKLAFAELIAAVAWQEDCTEDVRSVHNSNERKT